MSIVDNIELQEQRIDELSDADARKVKTIRTSMQGYVGKKFASKASDEDILKMVYLNDELANIHNAKIKPLKDQINILRKKYKLKPID